MYKLLLIIWMAGFGFIPTLNAQQNPWVTNTSPLGAAFQTPTVPTIYTADSIYDNPDSTHLPGLAIYVCTVDSSLSLQVHILDSSFIDTTDAIIDSIFMLNNGDTLRTIAMMMNLLVPSNITQLINISSPVAGMEIGLQTTFDSTNTQYIFSRYFIRHNRFFAFTVTGGANDLQRMVGYKNTFYNSIVINY